jgi:hypothetical protein
MALGKVKFTTKIVALLLGSAMLSASAIAQASKSGAGAAKTAVAASPTPTPTPSTQAKPGVAQVSALPPQPPIAPAGKASANNTVAVNPAGIDVDQMTSQQFRALPSTGMVRYKGKSIAKASFIDQRKKEYLSHQQKKVGEAANLDAEKAQLESRQASELTTRNARVRSVAEKYDLKIKHLAASPAYAALAREADGIVQQYPSASASEKARLKRRAAEIHSQMQKMEQGAVAGR